MNLHPEKGKQTYEYACHLTLEGFGLGLKYADTLEELKNTGMSEREAVETLLVERLQGLYQIDKRRLVELIVRQKLEELF